MILNGGATFKLFDPIWVLIISSYYVVAILRTEARDFFGSKKTFCSAIYSINIWLSPWTHNSDINHFTSTGS